MSEPDYDLVIRGGTVVDGSGAERRVADIAVKAGRIALVGTVPGRGRDEIDARGLLVTPGFVDVHTHYDGQATWSERMQPSSLHGVTTVVMGNCGVGFAPCRPEDRECLVRLMEGVEDIPNPVMTEGLPWNWESFPDFLDALAERRFDVDIGVQLAHAPLRVFVMGDRGVQREPADDADIARMAAIAREAIAAGALGFSTSRTINHKSSDGEKIPTYAAAERELLGIVDGLRAAGDGVIQLITDFDDAAGDFAMLRRLVERSGRPLSFSLVERLDAPADCRTVLDALTQAGDEGLPIRGQVACRPVGALLGLEGTASPFQGNPVYAEIAPLDLAGKVERLRDPVFLECLLAAAEVQPPMMFSWELLYPLDAENPDYEPLPTLTVAAQARAAGVSAAAFALDHMLSCNAGRGLLLLPIFNYYAGNLDLTREMLDHPYTIPGLSDGGAHMGVICDGSFPTTLLQHWTRDRSRGAGFSIEEVVKMQALDTAQAYGLADRGLLRAGMRADINIIDHARLRIRTPEFAHDLPAGGRRLIQRAEGYRYTIVAGEVTYRDGVATDRLPGQLVRGTKAMPRPAAVR